MTRSGLLTWCTNVLPVEGLDALTAALEPLLPGLRRWLAPRGGDQPLGLYLSDAAARAGSGTGARRGRRGW